MEKTAIQPTSQMEKLLAEAQLPVLPKAGETVSGKIIAVSKTEAHLDIDGITTGVIRGRELFDESGEYANLKVGDVVSATVLDLENETGEMELSFRQAGHAKAWDELRSLMERGEVISVSVIDANKGGLMVKVARVEGFLPVSQLTPEHYPRVEGGDKQRILEILQRFVGQSFQVKVIDVNDRDDKLIVSEKAAWEKEQQARLASFNIGQTVEGKVTGVVDFGIFIEFAPGLEGLAHISELAWQRVEHPRDLYRVGQPVKVMIIGIEGSKISLSVKRLTEDPWEKAAERYTVGQVVSGKVVKLNPFGAFVELDPEIQGLCHISELAERRIRNPEEVAKVGETRQFKIISIDGKAHRLGLSIKALEEKPKEESPAAEPTGSTGASDIEATPPEAPSEPLAEQNEDEKAAKDK